MSDKVWGDYDQAALDKAYDARGSVPDFETTYLPAFSANSQKTRRTLKGALNVPYGPHRDQVLDIFPADSADAPVNVFIHGGYWRMLTKDESSYAADALTPAGVTSVIITYSLTPGVHLDVIVRQCREAVAWTYRNIHRYNGNARRLYVSGHSAGGHLTGMVLATDWAGDYGLPSDLVKGATALSGLYDLEPVNKAQPREWLQLTPDQVQRNSPIHHMPPHKCPVIVAWGGGEPDGFPWQSNQYADALEAHGCDVTRMEIGDLDHFAVGDEMAKPDSDLTVAMKNLMELDKHSWKS